MPITSPRSTIEESQRPYGPSAPRVMRFLKVTLLALGVMIFASSRANAIITTVFDPANLTGGPFIVEHFDGPRPIDGELNAHPGAHYGCNGSFSNLGITVTPSPPSGCHSSLGPTIGIPIPIVFAYPMSSGGMWFGNDDPVCGAAPGGTAFLDIYGSNGLLGTIQRATNNNKFADQFLGFNSDQLVTKVVFRYNTNLECYPYIDDVYFNLTALNLCESNLDQCEEDLDQCQSTPVFLDADGDGEHDNTDTCPDTLAGEPVDQDGCSLDQFCGRIVVSATNRNSPCNLVDWRNDEPFDALDCKPRGGVCVPR